MPASTPAAAVVDAPTCAVAADHTIDTLSKDAGNAPPDLVKKLRETLAAHCEKDQWSAATRTCLANIKSKEEAPKCEETLTDAQRRSLDAENVGGEEGAPEAAPAPVPSPTVTAPPAGSRGPTTKSAPKRGGDPEDGGD